MDEKKVLTDAEVATVVQVYSNLFAFGLGLHPDEMDSAASILDVAAGLLKRCAEIKRGYQVPWQSMCYVARLPAASKHIHETEPLMSRMLSELGISVLSPTRVGRGCALPGFLAKI